MSRRIYWPLSLLVALHVSAAGQETVDAAERIRLRELLRVPAGIEIALARDEQLPQSNPIKLFLATGMDFETPKNFERWMREWNRKQGNVYGAVEVVDEMEKADIILARFTDWHKTHEVITHSPAASAGGRAAGIGLPITDKQRFSPAYSYLIVRSPDRLLVLWRGTAQVNLDAESKKTTNSGREMRDALFGLLRERAKQKP